MNELHATASDQLDRLFPNKQTHVPDGNEAEPSSDVEDDFDTDEGLEEAEYARMAAAGTVAGVPTRRSGRAAAAVATAAADEARERERAPMPTDPATDE
jgi:hypothetical protein